MAIRYEKCIKVFKGDQFEVNEKLMPELDAGSIIKDIKFIGADEISVAILSVSPDRIPVDPYKWPEIESVSISGLYLQRGMQGEEIGGVNVTTEEHGKYNIVFANRFGIMVSNGVFLSPVPGSVKISRKSEPLLYVGDEISVNIEFQLPEGYDVKGREIPLYIDTPVLTGGNEVKRYDVKHRRGFVSATIVLRVQK